MIEFKAILPNRFNRKAFDDEFRGALKKMEKQLRNDFNLTVRTWNNKPKFVHKTRVNESEKAVDVQTAPIRSRKPPEAIYYMLNNGTQERFAKMTPGFQPKTTPGVISSGPGVGGLEQVTPGMDWGGITARKWDRAIALKNRRRFVVFGEAALMRAARGSGHRHG